MEDSEDKAAVRVLVVDDSVLARRLAGSCVEDLGAVPFYAEDGREALGLLEDERADVVLTDLLMPDMDGLELTRAIGEQYPGLPVVVMTAHGSEDVAIAALRAGAVNYLPKDDLRRDLGEALRAVLSAARAAKVKAQVGQFLVRSESRYVLGYQRGAGEALLAHLTDDLTQIGVLGETEVLQVRTALTEAVRNALDHGNLELDSRLRESSDRAYRELGLERAQLEPFRSRRVHITAHVTPTEIVYVVRDEGRGFDQSCLPDPRASENVLASSGRGVLMMRMFMDEVRFNAAGNEVTMVLRPRG